MMNYPRIDENLMESDVYGHITLYLGQPFTGTGFTLYPNGNIEYEATYIDGVFDGVVRSWYENGQIESEVYGIEGVKHGEETQWFSNGNIKHKATYEYALRLESHTWNELGELINHYTILSDPSNLSLLELRRQQNIEASSEK